MATQTSNKDKNTHRQQELDDQNMHHPKGFLQANDGDISWRDETGNISYIPNPVLPGVLNFVDSSIAPPTEADGDIYLLDATGATLDVDTILFQSGNIIRYTFNGSPDLSGVSVNDFIEVLLAGKASNNGVFKITTVNDGSDFVEVTNTARSDATDDEASDSPATGTITHGDWDGATQNSWVKFNIANGTWDFITPFIGLLTDDLTVGEQRRFDGTTWAIMTSLSGGGTLNKIARWTGASSLGDSIMTEAGTVLTVAGGLRVDSAINNKTLDDAGSNALIQYDVFSQNDIFITSDDGGGGKGYLLISDTINEIFGGPGTDTIIYGDNLIGFSVGGQDFLQGGFGANIKVVDNSSVAVGSSAIDKAAIFVGSRAGTINSGIVNSVIVGGVGVIADKDDYLFTQNLEVQNGILEVVMSSGNALIRIDAEGGGADEARLELASGATSTKLFYRDSDDSFGIFHKTITRFRIQADGTILLNEGGDNVGINTTLPNQPLTLDGTMSFKEQAAANADTAAYGQLWVRSTIPNRLMFTNDVGTDFELSAFPKFGVNTATQSFVSNTTLANVTNLSASIEANKNYHVKVVLFVSVGVGGMKAALNGPAGFTSLHYMVQLDSTIGLPKAGLHTAYNSTTGLNAANLIAVEIHGTIINGATAGTVTVRAAQEVSDVASSDILRDSFILVEEII